MPSLVILGTADAVPDLEHENTHLALVARKGVALVDCAGRPTVRLAQAGIEIDKITDLILTHFHPDHVYGVPLLLMNLWLLGRRRPLPIHGTRHCLDRLQRLMDDYLWKTWPGFFGADFRVVKEEEGQLVVEGEDFKILSSPVDHLVPTLALRFESVPPGRAIAYSSDTAPSLAFVRLAKGVNVLIHEASGDHPGHSSAAQAGEVAHQAGAERLLLIHCTHSADGADRQLAGRARQSFGGAVDLAKDLMVISL